MLIPLLRISLLLASIGIIILFGNSVEHIGNDSVSKYDVAKPENPMERAQWWAEVQGPPATRDQLEQEQNLDIQKVSPYRAIVARANYLSAGRPGCQSLRQKMYADGCPVQLICH